LGPQPPTVKNQPLDGIEIFQKRHQNHPFPTLITQFFNKNPGLLVVLKCFNHLEKQSMGRMTSQYIMENKTCSKPPTSNKKL
jgi:hypothetical protein